MAAKVNANREYQGELRVAAQIDVAQFWNVGKSDADTVTVTPTEFKFSPDPQKVPFKTTTALNGAWMGMSKGKRQTVIHNGKMTIRLQGIDATELHYREYFKAGLTKNNVEYRQFLAETAATKLHDLLAGHGAGNTVPCMVVTRVDLPDQVFDIYRRFVGDIVVTIGSAQIDVNHWLVEQGWAFPTFYTTMRNDEIQPILKLATAAQKASGSNRRVWGQLSAHVGPIKETLIYRSKGKPNPNGDVGKVVMPKLFRRRVTYTIDSASGLTSAKFPDYLKAKTDDKWVRTSDFLKNRAAKLNTSLSPPLTSASNFGLGPGDLVFSEKQTATLKGANGKDVKRWF
jgi:endonuclease YncB( thermonuclease family)